jgi:hypothetical protein
MIAPALAVPEPLDDEVLEVEIVGLDIFLIFFSSSFSRYSV